MALLVKKYGAAECKTFINRPAVNTDLFSRHSAYRENKKINILSIGRLIFQKGLMIGLMAIKELVNHYPNFTWTIVGDGPEEEELIFYIDLLGLQNNIILAGKKSRDEVFELYSVSDIFFLPSVSEGIANVVLEAMSMQLPVVSSDTGGMQELITHNKDGIICKNYDYAAMAKELQLLCNCFDKRLLLGQAGRKTIEQKFSIKRYIDIFENEYRQLLA